MASAVAVKPLVLLVGNFLSRHRPTGGTRTVGEDLAEHLRVAGWPVVTTSSLRPRLLRFLDMQRAVWLGGRWQVAQVDVYSGAAFRWAEAAAWALGRRRVPVVLTLHGGDLPRFAERSPRRVGRLLAAARAVTVPSPWLAEAMAAWRRDLVVLPNALDLAAYPFVRRERVRPRLVWLRAFHAVYRPRLAVEVLAELAADTDASLLMVGPDKGDGSLGDARRRASELGLGERVVFAGAVPKDEVAAWLGRGDVFLNTSEVDNAPVTVTEAMACGLPVVTTDAGGLRHLVTDGEDALVVRGDAPTMASAVRRLVAEPGLAARLTVAARRKVEEHDWSRVLPRWEALLEEHARS